MHSVTKVLQTEVNVKKFGKKYVDTCWVYEWMIRNGEIVQTVAFGDS